MGISFILEKTGRNSQITIETKIKWQVPTLILWIQIPIP